MAIEDYSIESEDGNIYVIRPFHATMANMEKLWEIVQKHEVLTSAQTRGNFEFFVDYVLSPGTIMLMVSQIREDGEEEDVGVLYADSLRPAHSAAGHFVFWDFRQAGRQRVILLATKLIMEEFNLHRVDIELPIHAFAALRRVKKMGIKLEGRRRGAYKKEDVGWIDSLLFGILREELTEEAIDMAEIEREEWESEWFGLLDDEEALAEHIYKGG